VFGGNHRRLALRKFVEALVKRHDQLGLEVDTMPPQEHRTREQQAEADDMNGAIKTLGEAMKRSKLWLVVAYDLGTPTVLCKLSLSLLTN
jgi:hypothetical protein